MSNGEIITGDCVEVMAGLPAESVDAIVTDPPYELGFMGKAWDASGVAYQPATWRQAFRVLKPGGHLLAFGGSRTYHRMACAVEDAGFEIRDQLMWLYGSGFPKSLDVSKAIDKTAGAEREVVGKYMSPRQIDRGTFRDEFPQGNYDYRDTHNPVQNAPCVTDKSITAPATPEAQQWDGWGTALKPAHEPIVMARKPFPGTVANNVLKHGTGAINVDGCRVEGIPPSVPQPSLGVRERRTYGFGTGEGRNGEMSEASGRWPANLILDEEAGKLLDEMSGDCKVSGSALSGQPASGDYPVGIFGIGNKQGTLHNDSGGVSRFFYCAKASRRERNAGLDGMEERGKAFDSIGYDETVRGRQPRDTTTANHHPTVKPIALMRWLVRLVTPPGGVVLDPFTGSGSTLCAAVLEGFRFIGIEMEPEYVEIAERRVAYFQEHGEAGLEYEAPQLVDERQIELFTT